MPSLRFALLAPAVTLAACTARPAPRTAPRLPVQAATAPGLNTTGPWSVAVSYAQQRVTITTRATVVITGDPATRTDTLLASLGAEYSWARAARRRVSGSLIDYRVAAGGGGASVPAGLTLGRVFVAEESPVTGGLAFLSPAESSACSDPALSVLQGLQDAWIPFPDTLLLGQSWSDTVYTRSCRDRLPVHGMSVRRFRVQRAEIESGRAVVLVDRNSKGRITVNGDQFGEPVTAEGKTEGMMHYVLDATSGRMLRATGTSSLDMDFKSRRRNQRVQQESALILAWNP